MLKKHYDVNYNENADYKEHKKIWIITPEEEIEYKVFAAREIDVNADADVYTISFTSQEEYEAYLKEAKEKSQYDVGTNTDTADRMLTLSTCTSSSEAGRFVVQAIEMQRIVKE